MHIDGLQVPQSMYDSAVFSENMELLKKADQTPRGSNFGELGFPQGKTLLDFISQTELVIGQELKQFLQSTQSSIAKGCVLLQPTDHQNSPFTPMSWLQSKDTELVRKLCKDQRSVDLKLAALQELSIYLGLNRFTISDLLTGLFGNPLSNGFSNHVDAVQIQQFSHRLSSLIDQKQEKHTGYQTNSSSQSNFPSSLGRSMRPSLLQTLDFTQDVSMSFLPTSIPASNLPQPPPNAQLSQTNSSVSGSQRALAIRKLFALIKGKSFDCLHLSTCGV